MVTAPNLPADMTLHIEKSISIAAPIQTAFDALIRQLGPDGRAPEGADLNFKFEPRVGGRWYRDLGNDAGHLWGHVQVFKPPTLLEITGPLFMSYPVVSHVQYRFAEEGDSTALSFTHQAVGMILEDHRRGVNEGWGHMLEQIRAIAEGA